VALDTDVFFNAWGMHDTAVNNTRITFTVPGFYLVGGNLIYDQAAGGVRDIGIRLNGGSFLAYGRQGPSGSTDQLNVNTVYVFAVSDYIELIAFQSSGGPLDVQSVAFRSTELWVHFLSGGS